MVIAEQAATDTLSHFCAQSWILTRGLGATVSKINTALNSQASIDIGEAVDTGFRPVGIKRLSILGSDWELERMKVVNHVESILAETQKKYYFFDDNQTLILFPMAFSDLYIEVAIAPLPSASGIDEHLYDFWLDPIVSGIKARLFRMPGKQWTDLPMALASQHEYDKGLVNARRQLLKSFSRNTSPSVTPRSNQLWL
jgi:hypothetical protein